MVSTKYFQCPYCSKFEKPGRVVPKTVGRYRVKILYDYILVFKCEKCSGIFRVKMMGKPLLWNDLSLAERKAHRTKEYEKKRYKKFINGGNQDGKI